MSDVCCCQPEQSKHEENGGCAGIKPNGNGKYPSTTFQRPKKDKNNMTCWGCGGLGHSWRECSTPRQGNNLPFKPNHLNQNQGDRQNLNGWQGEETQSSNPLPVMIREESTSTENESKLGYQMGWNITVPIHGLECWVEQMRPILLDWHDRRCN